MNIVIPILCTQVKEKREEGGFQFFSFQSADAHTLAPFPHLDDFYIALTLHPPHRDSISKSYNAYKTIIAT